MKDALLVVDVVQLFEHEDGDALLVSFRDRLDGLRDAIARARAGGVPVIYVNDSWGRWASDAPGLVEEAVAGRGGDVVAALAPQSGDAFVLKPRYSVLDHTPLVLLLRELEIERILLSGAASEMCVMQSAIDAREEGFKVSVIVDACAAIDQRLEQLSFEYLERVVGARLLHVAEYEPGRD
jgi:nicotinamidase-related amidase